MIRTVIASLHGVAPNIEVEMYNKTALWPIALAPTTTVKLNALGPRSAEQ
jgi:lipoate-protein ligase B